VVSCPARKDFPCARLPFCCSSSLSLCLLSPVTAPATLPIAHTSLGRIITVATIEAVLRKTNSSDNIHALQRVYREVAALAT
jgi:hypothetical protein